MGSALSGVNTEYAVGAEGSSSGIALTGGFFARSPGKRARAGSGGADQPSETRGGAASGPSEAGAVGLVLLEVSRCPYD